MIFFKFQFVSDNRYYTIRYIAYRNSNNRPKFVNATTTEQIIQDLKPNTEYEFAVKVVKVIVIFVIQCIEEFRKKN